MVREAAIRTNPNHFLHSLLLLLAHLLNSAKRQRDYNNVGPCMKMYKDSTGFYLDFKPSSKSSAFEGSPVLAKAHNINTSRCHSKYQLA
jgi:hypothetical protein